MDNNNTAAMDNNNTAVSDIAPHRFSPDRIDFVFAFVFVLLGYLWVKWVPSCNGLSVSLFTFIYAAAIFLYFYFRHITPDRQCFFWLALLLLTGLSYLFVENYSVEPFRKLFLTALAVMLVLTASANTVGLPPLVYPFIDALNGFFIIPFSNLFNQIKAFFCLKSLGEKIKKLLSALLGVAIFIGALFIVMPLLLSADGGFFAHTVDGVLKWFEKYFAEEIFMLILSLPVGAYLFGLVSGSLHKRYTGLIKEANLKEMASGIRRLPSVTAATTIWLACLLYLLFIGAQVPYFFSAFTGKLPAGFEAFSEYARSGFFELCSIAAINLLLVWGLGAACKSTDGKALKAANISLSVLTILLIITAASKMFLYIDAYGLSQKRFYTLIVLAFLLVLWSAVIARQFKPVYLGRFAAFAAAGLLCILSFVSADRAVAEYNASRYLNGSLNDFDVTVLYSGGSAGESAARRVLESTGDESLKQELLLYLNRDEQRKPRSENDIRFYRILNRKG